MSKLSRIFISFILAILPVLSSTVMVRAAADTCTWTGAVDDLWSDGGNWSGCDNAGVPENGDALVFPEAASNKTTFNDLALYSFTDILISGSGYTLTGANLTLTGTVALVVSQSADMQINITYAPSMNTNIVVASGQTLTVTASTDFSGVTGEVNIGSIVNPGTVDFIGNVTGDAGTQLIAVHSATAIVRGAVNTFTASTVGAESGGVFECRSATCFGDNANDIYAGNGTVEIHVSNTFSNNWQTSSPSAGDSWIVGYADISITGDGTVNDPVGLDQPAASTHMQFTGSITLNGSVSLFGGDSTAGIRIDGGASGAEAFSIGSGDHRLAGSSTYLGTNTINSGAIVTVTGPSALGSDAGITNILSGSSVRFDNVASTTVSEPLQVNGSGLAGEGAVVLMDETTTLSGNIVLAGNTTFGLDTGTLSGALMLSGVISGTADISLVSSATTDYSGTSIQFTGASANTYVGSTTVQGLRFYPAKANSVVAVTGDLIVLATATKAAHVETSFDESIADSSHVTLTMNGVNNADLSIGSGATETIGYVTGDGEVSLGGNSELFLSSNTDYTFVGQISKFTNFPAGLSTIHKQGTGTATFNGTVKSTYGSFYPTLQADGGVLKTTSSTYNNIDTVVTNGTILKGSGTVGAVTIQSGGAINVGNSPGCMTLGSLNLNSGATFTEEITGTTACTEYDQTTVTGAADITNATLQISLTNTPADGSVYTILTAGTLTGTFNGLANGATVTVSGVEFRINYTATSVTLTKLSGALSDTGTDIANTLAIAAAMVGVALLLTKRSKPVKK